jgi:hypothetical protein
MMGADVHAVVRARGWLLPTGAVGGLVAVCRKLCQQYRLSHCCSSSCRCCYDHGVANTAAVLQMLSCIQCSTNFMMLHVDKQAIDLE